MSKYPENMSLVKLTVFVILLGFLSTFVVCKDDTDAFDEFIKQYKKTYRNDTKEYWKRFEIFEVSDMGDNGHISGIAVSVLSSDKTAVITNHLAVYRR